MKALVIFSGGQDSTTCLGYAMDTYDEVEAINFNYGQKHAVEIEQARQICKHFNVKLTEIDISFLGSIVESALTDHGDVTKTHPKNSNLPASFVPNRNALFITLSHAFAQKIDAKVLIGGMCQTDYSGYPDCRREFIDLIEVALNNGSDANVSIETPLMFLTKAQTFKLANYHGVLEQVVELSHTCYNGNRTLKHDWGYGCGTCPACELRAKGWSEYIK